MSTYEVHVPCGETVKIVCKEADEEMKVMKNGKILYGNNSNKPSPAANNKPEPASSPSPEPEPQPKPEPAEATEEKSNDSSEEMAGGKRTRRNNSRKNNATRKNQAGGKKRGPNGYMKFANKIRPQILKEHPELKSDVVGVARKIGEKWRSMSAAEKAKY